MPITAKFTQRAERSLAIRCDIAKIYGLWERGLIGRGTRDRLIAAARHQLEELERQGEPMPQKTLPELEKMHSDLAAQVEQLGQQISSLKSAKAPDVFAKAPMPWMQNGRLILDANGDDVCKIDVVAHGTISQDVALAKEIFVMLQAYPIYEAALKQIGANATINIADDANEALDKVADLRAG